MNYIIYSNISFCTALTVTALTSSLSTPILSSLSFTGAWRSWLSRRPVKPEAAGSSPVAPE